MDLPSRLDAEHLSVYRAMPDDLLSGLGDDLPTARKLLLATHVGDESLSHDHGAPVRLVAPGRRGFEWVKWVTHVELHSGRDYGAAASTVWSSFTPEGRGDA